VVDFNPPIARELDTLDEFSNSCTSDDGFCTVDWIQFNGVEQFP